MEDSLVKASFTGRDRARRDGKRTCGSTLLEMCLQSPSSALILCQVNSRFPSLPFLLAVIFP